MSATLERVDTYMIVARVHLARIGLLAASLREEPRGDTDDELRQAMQRHLKDLIVWAGRACEQVGRICGPDAMSTYVGGLRVKSRR